MSMISDFWSPFLVCAVPKRLRNLNFRYRTAWLHWRSLFCRNTIQWYTSHGSVMRVLMDLNRFKNHHLWISVWWSHWFYCFFWRKNGSTTTNFPLDLNETNVTSYNIQSQSLVPHILTILLVSSNGVLTKILHTSIQRHILWAHRLLRAHCLLSRLHTVHSKLIHRFALPNALTALVL